MTMGFFDGISSPVLTVILNHDDTAERVLELIREGLAEGAEAFCIQFEKLAPEDRTEENYRRILRACEGRPVYACDYRKNNTLAQTDEEIERELLLLADLGAELVDVQGDLFCPSVDQIAREPEAAARQKRLIQSLHERGCEVLMSSHTFRYMQPQEVIELMQVQQQRGADVMKVVAKADTDEEAADAFLTSARIRKELGTKHLFIVGGKKRGAHRFLSGELGDCLLLCTVDSRPDFQPPISAVKKCKALRESFCALQEQA